MVVGEKSKNALACTRAWRGIVQHSVAEVGISALKLGI